jgi:multidrug resistance efflux pump
MKTDNGAPIPIPFKRRLQELRLRGVPVLVFGGTIFAIAVLWQNHVAAPTMVGHAEPVLSNVCSYKAGVLAELKVARFQKVKKDDLIGQVIVTDPKVLESSLAVLRSEIEMLRFNLKPIATQQRTAMDYEGLRLDWMRERAQLATTRVNLQLAETEYHRMEELFKDKIVSQRTFDQAKAAWEKLRGEVEELSLLVVEAEANLKQLQSTNLPDITKISTAPVRAEIAVQEAKLKLTEAELSPILLKAPMDGIVTAILHRSGEAVTAGQPIVSIATFNPVRIVGYMRPPIVSDPKVGMRVEVRTRGMRRETGKAQVMEVGTQMEQVPPSLLGSVRLGPAELGLPIDISVPTNLNIRPGELVDIVFVSKAN